MLVFLAYGVFFRFTDPAAKILIDGGHTRLEFFPWHLTKRFRAFIGQDVVHSLTGQGLRMGLYQLNETRCKHIAAFCLPFGSTSISNPNGLYYFDSLAP